MKYTLIVFFILPLSVFAQMKPDSVYLDEGRLYLNGNEYYPAYYANEDIDSLCFDYFKTRKENRNGHLRSVRFGKRIYLDTSGNIIAIGKIEGYHTAKKCYGCGMRKQFTKFHVCERGKWSYYNPQGVLIKEIKLKCAYKEDSGSVMSF
jgi:hypothetical protein